MEFLAGGSVRDVIRTLGPLEEPPIAVICRELLKGLEYLHGEGYVHRDIKAANVLLSEKGDVKLADFGVAAQLNNFFEKRTTFVGTPYWMAPEVIKQSGTDQRADVWSLAITALEMAKGEPPHSEQPPMKALFTIQKEPSPVLEGAYSKGFKDFISVSLVKDPNQRPSAKEMLKHKWIKDAGKIKLLSELVDKFQKAKSKSAPEPTSDEELQKGRAFNRSLSANNTYSSIVTVGGWDFTMERPPSESARTSVIPSFFSGRDYLSASTVEPSPPSLTGTLASAPPPTPVSAPPMRAQSPPSQAMGAAFGDPARQPPQRKVSQAGLHRQSMAPKKIAPIDPSPPLSPKGPSPTPMGATSYVDSALAAATAAGAALFDRPPAAAAAAQRSPPISPRVASNTTYVPLPVTAPVPQRPLSEVGQPMVLSPRAFVQAHPAPLSPRSVSVNYAALPAPPVLAPVTKMQVDNSSGELQPPAVAAVAKIEISGRRGSIDKGAVSPQPPGMFRQASNPSQLRQDVSIGEARRLSVASPPRMPNSAPPPSTLARVNAMSPPIPASVSAAASAPSAMSSAANGPPVRDLRLSPPRSAGVPIPVAVARPLAGERRPSNATSSPNSRAGPMALAAVAQAPVAMNSRAELDELRSKLAESEKAKLALEASLKCAQQTVTEKEQELRRVKKFSMVVEEAFKLKEAETGRILTEHKSEYEKLRQRLTGSEQREILAAGGVVVTGQAISDALYCMLADSEDDKSANLMLKLKDDLETAERIQSGFLNKFAELIFENFSARARSLSTSPVPSKDPQSP